MEILGMAGGPVRAPSTPMSEDARRALYADLEATGILGHLESARQQPPLRIAV
jgi:hypothetical protein